MSKLQSNLPALWSFHHPHDRNEFIRIENNNKQISILTSFDNEFNTKIEMLIVESFIKIVDKHKINAKSIGKLTPQRRWCWKNYKLFFVCFNMNNKTKHKFSHALLFFNAHESIQYFIKRWIRKRNTTLDFIYQSLQKF